MAYPIHPIAKSLTHVARFKYAGVNIEQFIREAFSRQNDLSGSFFSSFSFSTYNSSCSTQRARFFPYSKLNQNYIENNGEDNGIINGLLTEESMAALVLKWDGEILQSFCICTRASAKSFAITLSTSRKSYKVHNFESLVKSHGDYLKSYAK